MIDYDRFLARAAERMQESGIRKMGAMLIQIPDVISFAPGYPATETFPWRDLQQIAGELLSGADGNVLQYGPTRGHRPLLDALVEILHAIGIAVTPAELLITTGSQQALDLVARVVLDPGDVVLVELPSYTGAIAAFRNAQADLVGVKQQPDGIDLLDLDEVLARERSQGRRVRFLYVVPNFQNPTGRLMSQEKRKQLLEWASRHDLLIVEDDPYGTLYFDEADAPETRPIKADDREGRVVYLGTFSKTLAPGFRVGWMAAPAPLVSKFELAKQAGDLCTGGLDQRVVLEAYRRGVFERQVPLLRNHYREKHGVMARALHEQLGGLLQWNPPRGGFFIWARLPESLSAEAMLTRALVHRVIYVAGPAFFVDGSGSDAIRLCFSTPTPDRIVEGVKRLARTIQEEVEHRKNGLVTR